MGKTQKIGNATIMNVDCMEYMRTLPDKFFDLAIVDPPYGIGMDRGKIGIDGTAKANNYLKKDWDGFAPTHEYFNKLTRVSKNHIIWGANHFADALPCPKSPCWIVWDKEKVGGLFADSELAWTSFKTVVRNFKYQWHGMLQGDMKNKEARIHPTQKPIKLYEWIFTNYAKPGQKIFDSHMGSGSSAIACNNLGFEYVGCELDEDYYNAACERIAQHARQQRLFA